MERIVIIIRVLVAMAFIVFGLNYWLKLIPIGKPTDPALSFISAMATTKYLDVVKVLEVVGGFFLLTGRFAPLGLTILIPVTVNIALWDAFLVKYAMPPIGTVLLGLELVLLFAYRRYFVSVFTSDAKVVF